MAYLCGFSLVTLTVQQALSKIEQKANYYKMLIVAHARGEYLAYQLLMNDSGLLSDFRKVFESFVEEGKTTVAWYNNQVNTMLEYYDFLNDLTTSMHSTLENQTTKTTETEQNENTNTIYSPGIPGGSDSSIETNLWDTLANEYEFFTGAGGRISTMNVSSDGSFTGLFTDYDVLRGEISPISFDGKYSSPLKQDEYMYTATLEEFSVEEKCSDSLRNYIVSSHNFIIGNEVVIFLPGIRISDIPQEYQTWFDLAYGTFIQTGDTLPFPVIMCDESGGYLPSENY